MPHRVLFFLCFLLLSFVHVAIAQNAINTSVSEEMRIIDQETYVVKIYAGSGEKSGLGTGFVFKDDGTWFIATNNHVVASAETFVWVQFHEKGAFYRVRIIGRDPVLDVALLETPSPIPSGVEPATLGRSRNLSKGDRVYAIGYPYGVRSITVGYVNALEFSSILSERLYLSTQTPMHPGNSGGPLIKFKENGERETVAINSAIMKVGLLSFSLGIDHMRRILQRLKTEKVVYHASPGIAVLDVYDVPPPLFETISGLSYSKLQEACTTILIVGIESGGVAEGSGIQKGDCIIGMSVGGRDIPLSDAKRLTDMIFFDFRRGDTVVLQTTRGRQVFRRTIILGVFEEEGLSEQEK